MKTTGTIIEVLELKQGISKAGKEWKSQSFVIDNNEDYNNILCVECFGDKVDELSKYKVGNVVEVDCNVSSRKWTSKEGKTSYFTKASAWKIQEINKSEPQPSQNEFEVDLTGVEQKDLPF